MGIAEKLVAILAAVALAMLLVVGLVHYYAGQQAIDRELNQSLAEITKRLALSLSNSVYEYDSETIRDTLVAEFPDQDVTAILVWTGQQDAPFYGLTRRGNRLVETGAPPEGPDIRSLTRDITVETGADEPEIIGQVELFLNREHAQQRLRRQTFFRLSELFLVVYLLVLLLAFVTNRYLVRPLERIRHAMAEIEQNVLTSEQANGVPAEALTVKLGPLSPAFAELNRMSDNLEKMVEAIRIRQQALQQSQASLAKAQHIAQLGNWDWNLPANEMRWSDQVSRIFDLPPQQSQASYEEFLAVVHPDDWEMVKQAVDEALNRKKAYGLDFRIIRANGEERIVHAEAEVTFDHEARPLRMVGTVQDITQRKQLEEQFRQAQKMEAIGRLTGGIAHDFNNLLVPIIGYVELGMMHLSSDNKLYADLMKIRQAAERAADLTRQIMAFSRQQVLDMQVLDLNAVIIEFKQMVQHLIGEHIELQTFLTPSLYPVKADKSQMEQVLMNLTVNARDAMPEGGKLTIETDNVFLDESYLEKYAGGQAPGPYVMLVVSDTGHGMDTETQKRIFDPFFTTKERGKGTGLGLSTTFGIIKQHQGNIWLYSEPGRGTAFKIFLPKAETKPQTAAPALPDPLSISGAETVLVAEDEEMIRKLVCETLEAHGYDVIEAKSPVDCLQLASGKDKIHLLLTDVIMPEMNGQELYQKVLAFHPDIKVLYMSGYTDNVTMLTGLLDEDVNFLQKPFAIHDLTRKVRQVLC